MSQPVLSASTNTSATTGSVQSRTTTGRRRDKDDSKNFKVQRLKPSKLFFVTVNLKPGVLYDEIRSDFVDCFTGVITYCCAVEISKTSNLVSEHLHCFLEFSDGYLLSDLVNILRDLFFEHFVSIDVQNCRSKQDVLRYISKEDRNVYYNCKITQLSINYQIYYWAANTPQFKYSDSFVITHRNQYRYIERVHNEIRQEIRALEFVEFPRLCSTYIGWPLQAARAWYYMLDNRKKKKVRKLYLYGGTNCGKSTYIEKLIGFENLQFVFYPGVGKFFMQGFNSVLHRVILFEEFNLNFYPQSMLKRLLEGRPYSYPVKCEQDKSISFNGPIVFVSNFFEINDDALLSRLTVINADRPYWEEEEMAKIKEINSTEEVVSLVSEEEI